MSEQMQNEGALSKWEISGPDDDGHVSLTWEADGRRGQFNLGPVEGAGEKMADWLAKVDYGE